jgi:hypothetical protein
MRDRGQTLQQWAQRWRKGGTAPSRRVVAPRTPNDRVARPLAAHDDGESSTIEGDELGRSAYLWLLKQCLTNMIYRDARVAHDEGDQVREFDLEKRRVGLDWPLRAHTMVGLERLDHLQRCVEDVIRDAVPGDLIETGVWRGGACILMRAILRMHGVTDRIVWVADSFAGLPAPDPDRYPLDAELDLHEVDHLAVTLEEVRTNFDRYGLLDDQVRFLEGWFRDTLPSAPIDRLAILRLDGDLYESTMDALTALYPRLSLYGYVIIDDYQSIGAARQAVTDYREHHGITERIELPEWSSAAWRKIRPLVA